MTLTYISIDPGSARTGVVEWNEKGENGMWYEYDQDELADYLDSIPESVKVVIVEEYRVYSHIPHSNSKVETVQVIGTIKYAVRIANKRRPDSIPQIKLVEQRSDVKKVAQKWSQLKVERGHLRDWKAAYLHGYYYLRRAGIIGSKLLEQS